MMKFWHHQLLRAMLVFPLIVSKLRNDKVSEQYVWVYDVLDQSFESMKKPGML